MEIGGVLRLEQEVGKTNDIEKPMRNPWAVLGGVTEKNEKGEREEERGGKRVKLLSGDGFSWKNNRKSKLEGTEERNIDSGIAIR
ncbi:hypothetical protein HZH66_004793 [Vespula vulgaris]|uniref:Uncharacterized protein n=1 Tax=Vespula vulgaris TaxID=7454 RepID=A0A834KEM6_VESVU|nr:hypothetical protein HZH66_004793 [Vespula vulgaris]